MDEDPDDPGWFDIERIYCFDWDSFTDDDWAQLNAVYSQLPGYRKVTRDAFPRWFRDTDDPEHGYLWASVEPPGLQVAGSLRGTDWEFWHDRFRALIAGLPTRDLH